MAVMNVNTTRMELSKLKKKLITARKGHKLLKDKRDELMRQFLILVRETKELRKEVESALFDASKHMALARSVMDDRQIETALLMPTQKMSINVKTKNVMSVIIPEFETELKSAADGEIFPYGFAFTSSELDTAVKSLYDVMPSMIKLAEIEKQCQLMSDEIEKTRRRVNALEHVMIPRYEETIKYITMKLEENERATTTRLMKVKDMMLAEAHNYNHE